ncbi:MAG: hypothetical protein IJ551_09840 [Prevotella sp.]|nr:hypothetical protein [Prevotella sp.]
MKREMFKNASYCHSDVLDYYKKMKPCKGNVPCQQIRLIASVAAAHLDMHTQVYLTMHGRNYAAVIPFTAYEFRHTWGRDPSEHVNYFKIGEVIHDIFAHFKKSRMSGFLLTSEYVGVRLCAV